MGKPLSLRNSLKLYSQALELFPAGVNSNARLWRTVCPSYLPCSIFIRKAKGSHIWDVDGNRYIDYRLGFGPVILGHANPKVSRAVAEAQKKGTVYAHSHPEEIEVAKSIMRMVPCAEMLRFANSGTEATMHALRIARAFTGKEKVVKFEGHYHGAHDYLLFSTEPPFNWELRSYDQRPHFTSRGVPKEMEKFIIVERWNSFHAIERTVKKHAEELAAIICEPVTGNSSCLPPEPGYLKWLRKLCDEYNIVLIFDEVKTGFRLAPGGAQQLLGVKPDLATFSKCMGNGYPVAAICGRREVMEIVGPHKVVHGGTFSSNPVSLAAVKATLEELSKPALWKHLQHYGRRMMRGMHDALDAADLDYVIQGFPAMFQVMFTKRDFVREYRELRDCDYNLYACLHYELLKEGVMIDNSQHEVIFTSASHNREDLEKTIECLHAAAKRACAPRSLARFALRQKKKGLRRGGAL